MTTARGTIGLLACLALAASVARADDYDPFRIPSAQFAERVRTIALQPMVLPADIKQTETVRRPFEEAFTRELVARGYTVVPTSEYDRIWRANSQRVGGTYNRVSGEPLKERWSAVRELTVRELADQTHADATMSSSVEVDEAPWKQPSFHTYFASRGMPLMYRGVGLKQIPQRVVGYRVAVAIRDLSDAKLYDISLPYEWVIVYVYRSYEERPQAEVFGNAEHRLRVVHELLDRLPRPTGASPQ